MDKGAEQAAGGYRRAAGASAVALASTGNRDLAHAYEIGVVAEQRHLL